MRWLNAPDSPCAGRQRGSSAPLFYISFWISSQFPIQIVIRTQLLVCWIDLHSSRRQFLLPLLIEKLDSDVQSAKVDSMQTLVKHPSDHHDCPSDGTEIRVSYKHYKLIPSSCLFVCLRLLVHLCTDTKSWPSSSQASGPPFAERWLNRLWPNVPNIVLLTCGLKMNESLSALQQSVFGSQVFQTASERVESAGLCALGAITSCLSRAVLTSDSKDSLRTFLELVLKGTGARQEMMDLYFNPALLLQYGLRFNPRNHLHVLKYHFPLL